MVDLKISPFAYIKTRQADVLDPYVDFIKKSEQITLVIWQEEGTSIKPLAIVRDPQLEHIDLVIYAVEIRSHGKVDTTEIGKLRTQEHKHLLKSKEYLLEARLGGSGPWQKVKGDIFKPVGSNSMAPDTFGDPGIKLLTDGLTASSGQSQWQVVAKDSIAITEGKGANTIGTIAPDKDVDGYEFGASVSLKDDPSSRYPQANRENFFCFALIALMIMPIKRDPKFTKILFWTKELGKAALG